MIIYLSFTVIAYLLAMMASYRLKPESAPKLFLPTDWPLLIVLIVFAGTRWHVGTDYDAYEYIFSHVISTNFNMAIFQSTDQEIGYYLLSIITKNMTTHPNAIFMTSSILTIVPIYSLLKRKSCSFSMSILLYILLGYYTGPFNIIRNGIALAINFYASQYLETNRKKFVVLNLIATTFHITAFLAMLFQLLMAVSKKRPTLKFLGFSVVGAVLLSQFLPKVLSMMTFIGKINTRYTNYFEGSQAGLGLKLLILLKILIIVYVLLFTEESEHVYYKTSIIFSIVFMIIGTVNVPVARFTSYFDICLVLLIPSILNQMSLKTRWLHQYTLTMIFLAQFILTLLYYGGLIPYQSYLI